MGTAGATNEVATLKEAVSAAECNAAAERAEREKQEARVAVVQQELQDAVKKCESLERDSKTQASELVKALQSAQEARAEAGAPFMKPRRPGRSRRVRLSLCKASL